MSNWTESFTSKRKSLINGLGRPHPDEQEEPEHPTALCTSYSSTRTWRITGDRTGLSPPAGYLHLLATSTNCGVESHSNVVINLDTTPMLTSTTLALRKDTLVYPGP